MPSHLLLSSARSDLGGDVRSRVGECGLGLEVPVSRIGGEVRVGAGFRE